MIWFHYTAHQATTNRRVDILVYLCAGGKGFKPLSWSLRLKIAIGAARGLAFLHNADKQIIYRDFKTSNVLLDSVCFSAWKDYTYHMYYQTAI